MTARYDLNVFTIPASQPFLQTLVHTLFAGELIPGFRPGDDPLTIADATILVPTRRAARALRQGFLRLRSAASPRTTAISASLLPDIQVIGDVDEGALVLAAREPMGLSVAPTPLLQPVISPQHRRLALAQIILEFSERLRAVAKASGFDDLSPLPTSAAHAIQLADDLARLMDAVETQEVSWRGLSDLVPDDYASYWGLTLEFLKIIVQHWPTYLEEKGLVNPAMHRSHLLRIKAEQLQQTPATQPLRPIIAAGSTGSIPATASLLRTIARLPHGAVVLPGLDTEADDETWAAIVGESHAGNEQPQSVKAQEPAHSHPQYGMAHLIRQIGIDRTEVRRLGRAPSEGALARARFVNLALCPVDVSDRWSDRVPPEDARVAALSQVSLIEANHEEEEALVIAVALREAVEENVQAALVTPDRGLATRVAQALRRWDIVADVSAGEALEKTAPANFMLLLAEFVTQGYAPETLAALLKHPYLRLRRDAATARHQARLLELAVLRGPRAKPGLDGLQDAFATARKIAEKSPQRSFVSHKSLAPHDWDVAAQLLADFCDAVRPFEALNQMFACPLATIIATHADTAKCLSLTQEGKPLKIGTGDADVTLAEFLESLGEPTTPSFPVALEAYRDVLRALMGQVFVRSAHVSQARVAIWGPLEARLQGVEKLVLSGLNEGVWPDETRTDAWLSRGMRARLGLQPPERQIGLSAHDFAQGLAAPEVVLVRSLRQDNVPTVASRWLQRLLALAGPEVANGLRARADRWLTWARHLDRRLPLQQITAPNPKPPPSARPKRLSVTRIETLIRDPYAIYAQYILGLAPLEGFGLAPDAAMKGERIHDVLARFAQEEKPPFDDQALAALIDMGEQALADLRTFAHVHAFWWPRFQRIAAWYVDWENERHGQIAKRLIERSGRLSLDVRGAPFTLTARADRIDIGHDGLASVIDFKTGRSPSAKQVQSLVSPQLPLEALILQEGGFEATPIPGGIRDLAYVVLSGGLSAGMMQIRASLNEKEKPEREGTASEQRRDGAALARAAKKQLIALIAHYQNPDNGYPSRVRPLLLRRYRSDYDHLARVAEWSLAEDATEDM